MDFFTGPFVQHIQNPQNKLAQFLYTQTNNHLVLFPPYQGDVVMETLDKIRDSNSGLDNIIKSLPHAHRAVLAVLFAAMSNTNPYIVYMGLFPTTDNYVTSVIKSMIDRDVVSTTRVLGIRAMEALNTRQWLTYDGMADLTPKEKQALEVQYGSWRQQNIASILTQQANYDVSIFGTFWDMPPRARTPDKKLPTKTPASSGGDSGSLFLILIILAVGFVAVNQSYF